jgi:hypothetical protein
VVLDKDALRATLRFERFRGQELFLGILAANLAGAKAQRDSYHLAVEVGLVDHLLC